MAKDFVRLCFEADNLLNAIRARSPRLVGGMMATYLILMLVILNIVDVSSTFIGVVHLGFYETCVFYHWWGFEGWLISKAFGLALFCMSWTLTYEHCRRRGFLPATVALYIMLLFLIGYGSVIAASNLKHLGGL